jgi:hypothetical protein
MLFRTQAGLSNSIVTDLEYIVYVNPRAYDALQSYEQKMKIASVVNLLNKHFADKRYGLMGPGRGSTDINPAPRRYQQHQVSRNRSPRRGILRGLTGLTSFRIW